MKDSIFGRIKHSIEIPSLFTTYISEQPFSNCISCEKELLREDSEYFIEKIFHANKIEIEYAICIDCTEKMQKKLSKESQQKITLFLMQNGNILERMERFSSDQQPNFLDSISQCLITGIDLENTKDYHICAHCKNNHLLFSHMPYMISGQATETINELISKETKDELDRFYDNHFGLPPEWKEILKSKRPVLL